MEERGLLLRRGEGREGGNRRKGKGAKGSGGVKGEVTVSPPKPKNQTSPMIGVVDWTMQASLYMPQWSSDGSTVRPRRR